MPGVPVAVTVGGKHLTKAPALQVPHSPGVFTLSPLQSLESQSPSTEQVMTGLPKPFRKPLQ